MKSNEHTSQKLSGDAANVIHAAVFLYIGKGKRNVNCTDLQYRLHNLKILRYKKTLKPNEEYSPLCRRSFNRFRMSLTTRFFWGGNEICTYCASKTSIQYRWPV